MIITNFGDSTEYMKGDEGYNVAFIRAAERLLNDEARARGYLYLNQIYEALGIPWNPANENKLFVAKPNSYNPYPGRFLCEYFPGSESLLVHDLDEEQS